MPNRKTIALVSLPVVVTIAGVVYWYVHPQEKPARAMTAQTQPIPRQTATEVAPSTAPVVEPDRASDDIIRAPDRATVERIEAELKETIESKDNLARRHRIVALDTRPIVDGAHAIANGQKSAQFSVSAFDDLSLTITNGQVNSEIKPNGDVFVSWWGALSDDSESAVRIGIYNGGMVEGTIRSRKHGLLVFQPVPHTDYYVLWQAPLPAKINID